MAKFYAVDANGNSALLSINIQGFTQSLQQNGWCKLPNGLILQWLYSHDITNYESYESNKEPSNPYLCIVLPIPIRYNSYAYSSYFSGFYTVYGWEGLDYDSVAVYIYFIRKGLFYNKNMVGKQKSSHKFIFLGY